MLKRLAAIAAIIVLTVAAIELQVAGYVVSEARARLAPPEGVPPERIVGGGVASDGTTTLLAAGDIAKCREMPGLADLLPNTMDLLGFASAFDAATARAKETARLAARWPDAPILALGDIAYGNGRPVEFAHCFDPVWGALVPRLMPTPGNHEYKTLGAYGYYDRFGAQAGPGRRGWYAARVPGWLILSLNSEVDAAAGSAQADWLDARLSEAGTDCVLAFYHKPAHSLLARRDSDDARALFARLQRAGAALVLNGHNHFYERTAPLDATGQVAPEGGTVAFTVGTGGRTEGDLPWIDATRAAVFGRTGLLRLTLAPGGYDWAFVDAPSGETLDAGAQSCTPARG